MSRSVEVPSFEGVRHLPRVNVGCGRTPTPGWLNFDNSPSVRLAHLPLGLVLSRGLGRESRQFAEKANSVGPWIERQMDAVASIAMGMQVKTDDDLLWLLSATLDIIYPM